MKKDEVPQDDSYLSNANINEVIYAVDKDGKYSKTQSSGWDAKTIVLDHSLDLIEERLQETRKEIEKGVLSPIAYFMEKARMDVPILASYVGMWQWRVKRHLKGRTFATLSEKTLKKYAEVFEIPVSELKNPKF